MEKLSGKKLLILGGAANEVPLVARAQSHGVYVIVADYHTDFELSPAKKIADEAWCVSWNDIDTLEKMCIEAKVDGVLAGYSELRVDAMIRLCDRLNLPSYITPHQLEITRDKIKFKEACRASGVPVVREYACVEDVSRFPVIVKPVDRAGSIGISVASDRKELDKAYEYAMEMSITKQVIIEDYIMNATKVDAYYQIIDGVIHTVGMSDTVFAKENGSERVVQSGWMMPSVYYGAFLEQVDPAMRRMIQAMGIENGYLFFSGFMTQQNEFVFFECGFRLCGGHFYDYFPRVGGWNTQDLLICHSLTGSASLILSQREKQENLKNITVNFYAKRGTVGQISGMEEISQMPLCTLTLTDARVGEICTDNTAILSKLGMVHLTGTSVDELVDGVEKVYELFSAVDTEGNDMIYDRMDTQMLRHWWDK